MYNFKPGTNTIIVPKEVNFINDWKDFDLEHWRFPHILDKKIPGCGFTNYCISNDMDIILCSPRKTLIDNKHSQSFEDTFYFKGTINQVNFLEEYRKQKNSLMKYLFKRKKLGKPLKILVTYDSFRILKGLLEKTGDFNKFYIVVDEFQSIFTDSIFKPTTELDFLNNLRGINDICYVSATPMMKEYLNLVPELKDLPYYELDWETEGPERIPKPIINMHPIGSRSISVLVKKVIDSYKSEDWKTEMIMQEDGTLLPIQSREAVIYLNSVDRIIKVIKESDLRPSEVNIICAYTVDNLIKIRRGLGCEFEIGTIPIKGEPHKTFTFCTRTVYLGADFYSTNARSFIFSDINKKTLSVDISLDLPQILGRQRLKENPWRNEVEFYFKTTNNIQTLKEFRLDYEKKMMNSNKILSIYNSTFSEDKDYLLKVLESHSEFNHNKDDFITICTHSGGTKFPTLNHLIVASEKRAFDIRNNDYSSHLNIYRSVVYDPGKVLDGLKDIPWSKDRMKYLLETPGLTEEDIMTGLQFLPSEYRTLYLAVGKRGFKSLSYNIKSIKELVDRKNNLIRMEDFGNEVYKYFKPGKVYIRSEVKEVLNNIVGKVGYYKDPNRRIIGADCIFDFFIGKPWYWIDKTNGGKKVSALKLEERRIIELT